MLTWLQNPPKTLLPLTSLTLNPSPPFPMCSISPKPTKTSLKSLHIPTHPTPTTTDTGLKFREKILYLQALNINPTKVLEQNPDLRSATLDTIKTVETCLASMGIERSAIGRILDMHPQLLTSDPYMDLYPIFDFLLNDVVIPFNDIRKSIIRCPRILVCSVEDQLKPTFEFLKEFGFVGPNRITCQTTVLLVSSVELTLNPKIDYMLSLGFKRDDVVNMVLRSPGLLTFSIDKNFRPKVEYFLKEMNGNLGELKKFPQYFSFSLEGKIKPRHRLLVEHGFSLSLSEMLKVSDGEFNARLIEMQLRLLDDKQL
ncbi:transcription termination factor MTEF1, chloroplastic [Nicotiana tabacum]|uniref:Transcription termination factor MTEF1, chloroplastic-like n=1 Tax=Nicotiana tabacum TaxID=4097 RepID=A0A1S3Z061_TOBAC|nr:transcription termination factor MTEF1, chloroplastic [Nicotiana tomentosiformis]XP_016457763.1 PREDICTED: uncharacterized protein LOC107781555 [Nicotiana tabacum]XP_016457764.1 PREDICTED: uncharacterized protein LOC107781555 [Nicotiana tabacum]XP_018629653.1 transcription termination factor MTEF1, chloroplastic [Nicotiana tomentosiformis]XP_033514545.1 transcription termination factor MTEF1, chloroplastic [Nicotiana tomentosiformis]